MEKSAIHYYQNLYEVAAALNSAGSSESLLRSIVERVANTLEAKGCSLMMFTPDRKVLLHTTAYGLSDWFVRKGPVLADKSISEALEGKPVVILDVTKDTRIQYPKQAEKEGIVSVLSVPMMLRGETIGVIRVYTGERYSFTMEDIYFVGAVANLGAIALDNVRLYDTVEKDYTEFRQEMLEWRKAQGHEWMIDQMWF